MFSLTLRPCTTAVLSHALDPSVPWVWIRGHRPKRHIAWWTARVPLSESEKSYSVSVRSLEFDLIFPTIQFLEVLPEFWDHGVALFQMSKPVPDTLTLDRIPDRSIDEVLIRNGLHLAFYLPHSYETAQFRSPDRRVIERIQQIPEMAEYLQDERAEPGATDNPDGAQ
jgi:hypothetical protein